MLHAKALRRLAAASFSFALSLLLCGCSDRPTIFANPDPELCKTRKELASDAVN